MNRVEAAIQEGRCVLAIGGRALQNPEVMMELRRRSALPIIALGADPVDPAVALSAESLAPVLGGPGGVLVLVEPEGSTDGRALGELEKLLKGSKNQPRLVVAARAWNPFSLPMGLRLLKTEQEKARAQDFLASLPVPSAPVVSPAAAAAAAAAPAAELDRPSDRHKAAAPDMVDREEETAQLKAWLEEDGGAIVLSGPPGIGRRWIVEAVLADLPDGQLVRLPDLSFDRGIGADTFLARLAVAARSAGDERLHQALTDKAGPPSPTQLAALVQEVVQGEALKNRVWVLFGLESLLDRRDGSFYREGRLEMILRTLLQGPLALRLVFVSELQPEFHAEGKAQHIRRIRVPGLPGRTLHELFAAWHAPAFDRDRFGPITERTFGHPIAARCLAITARETDIDEILEQPRFLKSSQFGELEALGRHLKRRVEQLEAPLVEALSALALLHEAATPEELMALGVKRDTRLALMAWGLLEQTPRAKGRRYYVHPLVAAHLDRRVVEDYGRMESLGLFLLGQSRDARKAGDDARSIALALEGNRLLVGARLGRNRVRLPYPDTDASLDDIRSLIRRRTPRLDIARMRVSEALKAGAVTVEILLSEAELLAAEKAPVEQVEAAYARAAEAGPTPEIFHQEASWQLGRGARGKAVEVLERGAAAFPDSARMRRRLAALLLQQGRLEDAARVLREAMELEPMMADTYSLLGEVYVGMGRSRWGDAAAVIQEAMELAPGELQHGLRQAVLLHAQGAADKEARPALWEQAEKLCRDAWQADQGDLRAVILLSAISMDRDELVDPTRLDQIDFNIATTLKKRKETPELQIQQARVHLRRHQWREAEELIDRALKKHGGMAEAFAARGEMWEQRFQPFHAFEAWKAARERTAPETAARILAEEHLARLQALIESGMAAVIMREKGVEQLADPGMAGVTPRGEQRVRRRRKGRGQGDDGAPEEAGQDDGASSEEASPEEAAAEDEVAAPLEEAPIEEAPIEEAPEAESVYAQDEER